MQDFQARVDINLIAMYDRFLRSIHGITDDDRSELLKSQKDADKDLHDYDIYISQLENKLTFVKSQRERLLNHIAALNCLLSSIHRLPNEILLRIFCHVQASPPITYHRDAFPMINPNTGCILHIAAVCHRWRSLALSCSELWSKFGVYLIHRDGERSFRLERLIDLHLERSKQWPLTISIRSAHHDNTIEHPLLQKLVGCSSRWQNVSFSDFHRPTVYPSLCALNLPILETLERRIGEVNEVGSITSAPMLRTIRGHPTGLTDASLWPQITHLERQSPRSDLQSFFEVLELCTNLQHLEILPYYFGRNDVLASRIPPVEIPIMSLSLSFLEGNAGGTDDTLHFGMTSLTAPALSILELRGFFHPRSRVPVNTVFPLIQDFLVRSGCALTVLVIDGVSITDQELVDVLKRHRSLVDLTIKDPDGQPEFRQLPVTKAFIESLHTHRPSRLQSNFPIPLVPKLRSLHLTVESTPFDYQPLIDLISSRWIPDKSYATMIGVACLRSVVVHLSEPVDEVKCSPLVHFERSGMRIVIKGKDGDSST